VLRYTKVDPLHTARNGLGRLRDWCPDPPRPFGPFANDAVVARVEPHVPRGGASPSGTSIAILAGRATYVPQAAVTSGIQRTFTVTPRGLFGRMQASDLG
jgi:hypothetical protein